MPNSTNEYFENEGLRSYAIRHGVTAVSADVYANHSLIYLTDGIATVDETFDGNVYNTLSQINDALRKNAVESICWRFRWLGGEAISWVSIANESAIVHAESACWDPENFQLVAAVFAGDKQITRAVMATLMTNSEKIKGWIKSGTSHLADLSSARRRYIQVSRPLTDANASGTATAVLHPLAANPRESNHEHFYVVAIRGEDLVQKFRERLDMATSFAVLPDWADYLISAGRNAGLVVDLEHSGPTFTGLRVLKKPYGEDSWESVISAGLRQGVLRL